jgi:hypothetical protein
MSRMCEGPEVEEHASTESHATTHALSFSSTRLSTGQCSPRRKKSSLYHKIHATALITEVHCLLEPVSTQWDRSVA